MELSLCGLGYIRCNQIAGGVLIMWDRRVQEKLEDMVGTFFVLVQWQGMVDGFIWACLGFMAQMKIVKGGSNLR